MTLAICGYQLSLHDSLLGIHGLTNAGYDDSVYLGAAVRLVHGGLPYRNFDFVQPPGITLLMSPVALLGDLIGTRDAMAVARIITALVASANSALAAIALRRHGTAAMWVAGTGLAVFPSAVTADHTLTLEPYLVMFCLLGTVLLFSRGLPEGRRRLIIAGAAFGVAGAVKTWALLPAAAALLCCLPRSNRRPWPVVAGMSIGFGVPSLPFFLAAPGAFVRDVIVAQLHRRTSHAGNFSGGTRLLLISGLGHFHALHVTSGKASAGAVVAAVAVLALLAIRARHVIRLDLFVALAVGFILIGLLYAPEFFDYYAYFPAAFLALLLGVFVGHAVPAAGMVLRRTRTRAVSIAVATALVLTILVVRQDVATAASYLAPSLEDTSRVASEIPAGSCVLFDYPSLALDADRYVPRSEGCPEVVDPFGMWLIRDDGSSPPGRPPLPAAFVARWQSWLQRADYVVLFFPYDVWLPWTPAMTSYFSRNYVLLSSVDHVYVYDHFDRAPVGAAAALLQKGIASTRSGQPSLADSYFERVLAEDPADVDATFDLGVTAEGQGEAGAARRYYQRAIFLDPRDVSALYNLAVLDTASDPNTALGLYVRILQIDHGGAQAEFNYGLPLVRTGHAQAGRAEIAKALAADPGLRVNLPPGL